MAQFTEIIDEGFAFVKKCNSSGVQVAIISNWDPESFEIIKIKFPQLFNFFEDQHIVIPNMVGKTKPSAEIYNYALKKINNDPDKCFFIDDSKTNVEAAQRRGIKSVHHKNWNDTEQELIMLGLTFKP